MCLVTIHFFLYLNRKTLSFSLRSQAIEWEALIIQIVVVDLIETYFSNISKYIKKYLKIIYKLTFFFLQNNQKMAAWNYLEIL